MPAVVLLVATGRAPLPAQAPRDRQALTLLRDSLSYVRDTTALLAVEQREIDLARNRRDDPMMHLRLGLIALRLGELIGRPALGRCLRRIRVGGRACAAWPWPWLGIGLTAAARAEQGRRIRGRTLRD